MRFISTGPKPISGVEIADALRKLDPNLIAEFEQDEDNNEEGVLLYGDATLAALEICRPPGLFDEEIEEFLEELDEKWSLARPRVRRVLKSAREMVVAQVLHSELTTESGDDLSLAKLDLLWQYLFSHYDGLMQADGEGYYSSRKLIYAVQ